MTRGGGGPTAGSEPEARVEIVAHRGYSSLAPENTVAALRAALDAGATSLEWDVRVAACGTPVLFHDSSLERTTDGSGPLGGRTLDELKALDAGGWFSPRFRGERVPSLSDALAAVCDRARRIYPEIKEAGASGLGTILDAVRRSGLLGSCTFLSLDHDLLGALRNLAPSVSVGYVVEARERLPGALERASGDRDAHLAPDFRILLAEPEWCRRAHEAGVPLLTWTVDCTDAASRLVALGVRRITTNRVAELLRWSHGGAEPT